MLSAVHRCEDDVSVVFGREVSRSEMNPLTLYPLWVWTAIGGGGGFDSNAEVLCGVRCLVLMREVLFGVVHCSGCRFARGPSVGVACIHGRGGVDVGDPPCVRLRSVWRCPVLGGDGDSRFKVRWHSRGC